MKTLERKYSKAERIIAKAKFSSTVYLKSVLLAVVLGVIIAVVWSCNDKIEHLFTKGEGPATVLTDEVMRYVLLGAGILVLLSLIAQALSLYAKELIVTESQVVFRFGVFAVKNITIPIREIVIIETTHSLLQRILGTGTLSIVSDAEAPYKVKGVRGADRLTRRIMKQVNDVRLENDTKKIKIRLS
ncbi:MAG: PH domain-containing protein [Bacteroides sp.]|nr:PH domain-containing protein [Bacillota bacterium]MCM1394464.1 PH domain-containing protein [[Eubacterium] siraeum]MCM1456122.1 PH domain-containing protein [Bacteroides sp.]